MLSTTRSLPIVSLVIALVATTADAYVPTEPTRITRIGAYSEYGGGDIVFSVANPIPGCSGGFWLKKTDPGFQATLNTILSAYHARSSVRVYALPDQLWPGSAAPHCRLYAIELI